MLTYGIARHPLLPIRLDLLPIYSKFEKVNKPKQACCLFLKSQRLEHTFSLSYIAVGNRLFSCYFYRPTAALTPLLPLARLLAQNISEQLYRRNSSTVVFVNQVNGVNLLVPSYRRDYRFYEADMVHPNTIAVDYIWDKVVETMFSDEAIRTMGEVRESQTELQTQRESLAFDSKS